ncbi:MAG: CHAT domain-containing protein [Planctomycetes bacterium]|nr:CHAT domain-containing protein [Planctomycetota bacterium]
MRRPISFPVVVLLALRTAGDLTPQEPRGAHGVPAPPRLLEPGAPLEGVLASGDPLLPGGGPHRGFAFKASEAGRVAVRLTSWHFDSRLEVRSQNGETIARDDDGGPGDGAEAAFEAEAGKEYLVIAASSGPEDVGPFRVEVRREELGKPRPPDDLQRDQEWYEEALRANVRPLRKLKLLDALGEHYRLLDQPERARRAWEEGARLSAESGARRFQAVFERDLAVLLRDPRDRGALEGSLDRLAKGLATFEEVLDGSGKAETLRQIGKTQLAFEPPRTEEALARFHEALRLVRDAGDLLGEANVLGSIADAYLIRRGPRDPEQAVEHYERALGIHRRFGNTRRVGDVLGDLGSAWSQRGEVFRAMDLYREALAIHRQIKHRRLEKTVLKNLVSCELKVGQATEALAHLQEALEIYRAEGNRRSEGVALAEMARTALALGRYEKAASFSGLALAAFRETGERSGEGEVLWMLGTLHLELGHLERADERLRTALEIGRQTLNRKLEARATGSLGILQRRRGQTAAAIERYAETIALARDLKDPEIEAAFLTNLATAQSAAGEHAEAMKAADSALVIHRKNRNRRSEGIALCVLGRIQEDGGRPGEAAALYEEALGVHDATHNAHWQARTRRLLGRLQSRLGKEDQALVSFREAQRITLGIAASLERELDEGSLLAFLAREDGEGFEEHFEVLARLSERAAARDERRALLEKALTAAEDRRARALANAVRAAELRELLSPEGRKIWDRIRESHERGSRERTRAWAEAERHPGRREEIQRALGERLKALEDETASLELELKAKEPKHAALCAAPQEIRQGDLGRFVGPGGALAYYALAGERVAAIAWTQAEGIRLRFLDMPAARLREAVQKVLVKLQGRAGLASLRAELRELGRNLIGEFEGVLGKASRLVVVPDDALHLLPFEALVLGDGSYLVERVEVSYAPSIQVLALLEGKPGREAELELVVYGDPMLEGSSEPPPATERTWTRGGAPRFKRLPNAAAEIDDVARLFERKLVRRGQEVLESSFKREAGKGRVLHVVTHGEFRIRRGEGASLPFHSQRPDVLFRSGLVFEELYKAEEGGDDGFLDASEVLGLDLRSVDLVTLSACETAAGDVRGCEGKFGLERAIFAAGARTLVGSLWKVDDEAAGALMACFYRDLRAGKGKAEALRLAKLGLLEKRGSPGAKQRAGAAEGAERAPQAPRRDLSHPYYWAAFILSGDGGRL